MADFIEFKKAIYQQFESLIDGELFTTGISKDKMWEVYLDSFPEGSNPMYRERTEHDCQCCKQFIRASGNVVAIRKNKLVSIWDVKVEQECYQIVADAMAKKVKAKAISDVFRYEWKTLGTDFNVQLLEDDTTIKWGHFHYELPVKFVARNDNIGSILSGLRSHKEVFKRALEEISIYAIETTIELIEQGSLYRGSENKAVVKMLLQHKLQFDKVKGKKAKDNYAWAKSTLIGGAAKIRNTAIGTLLVDISDGKGLDESVRAFETKVAPTNYKRPTAVVTKGMIKKAQETVIALGIESALDRRYANIEDITINNILFADRDTKKAMNVFDELTNDAPATIKNLDKVEEVDIGTFINTILPKADSVELLVENKHTSNLMSLIAPSHADAKPIFKWGNNFSWAYNGEVTDSIKERVKKAGGNVDALLRCSLAWYNYDDLDIHVKEPCGNVIYYSCKRNHTTSGFLDIDMNIESSSSREAVENIVWTDDRKMDNGVYSVYVHNYTPRETIDVGCTVELEFDDVLYSFQYNKRVIGKIPIVKFSLSKKKGLEIIESIPSTQASKEVWGINTTNFHRVSMVMHSPNYWDERTIGNKHYFFILENCLNDAKARGFFNEFLDEGLREHRKVFEVLGAKMKTDKSNNQLSGIGFSTTQRNHVFCKVTGAFTRTIKIIF